ncbi:MAG: hypothetical protein Q4B90_09095 [Eubacteriales bacterium]|nr:hypothetical protein [Eubacteriales bacterium]
MQRMFWGGKQRLSGLRQKKGEASYKKDVRRKSNKWKKTKGCDKMEKKKEGGNVSEGSSGD